MKNSTMTIAKCLLLPLISATPAGENVLIAAPFDLVVFQARIPIHANFWGEVRFWRKGPKDKCNNFHPNDADWALIPQNGYGKGENIGCVNIPGDKQDMHSAYAMEPGNFQIRVYEKPNCNGQWCDLSGAEQLGRTPTCCMINPGAFKSIQIV